MTLTEETTLTVFTGKPTPFTASLSIGVRVLANLGALFL